MSIRLYYHPLSSFCWKVLIALYENDTPFEPVIVDLGDPASRDPFLKLWPVGKFPVIEDGDRMVPESTIIIEYLDQHYPGRTRFIPSDPDKARQMRMRDRFFDLNIHIHMQKVIGDRIRPAGSKDPFGVNDARQKIATALGMVEGDIASHEWAFEKTFTMADCAAAPALFYVDKIEPLAPKFPNTATYLDRLKARPSFARCLKEAEPHFKMFPA
ncbi:MAG: glutathione S-transferase family protein [Alphaproteobacteria bacterium]|nr:glutathione S-transferase family protein [Alphaproteobacteria bacterium]MBL7098638.1 glutathione S-transferase family protein [Alphaproteobacteria bacterium]